MTCGVNTTCAEILLRLLAIGLSNGSIIALNAIGVTLVYGAVRMINFAHGDVFGLTSIIVTLTVIGLGLIPALPGVSLIGGLIVVLGIAMAFGTTLNLVVERVAFHPFRGKSRLAPLIATVGLSFIFYQIAVSWPTPDKYQVGAHQSVPGIPQVPRLSFPELFPRVNLVELVGLNLHVRYMLKDLFVLVVAFGLALLVGWFLRATRAGRALRAAAQDPLMAQLCGVNRDATIRLAFGLGGALAGAAAFIFGLYYNHPFGQYGAESGLVAFTAAVLGGIGRPRGAFLSGLLIGVLTAASDYFLGALWTPAIVLLVLVVLLMLRPTGISGDESGDEVDASATDIISERRPMFADRRARLLVGGMFAAGLLYPLLDRALGWNMQIVITGILVFAILALGLNVLLGFAGLLDLGYAACFAIGGYTTALLTSSGSVLTGLPGIGDFAFVVLCSALAAAAFGVFTGAMTLRLRGDYLAMVTLAIGQIVPHVLMFSDTYTNGARGISALPPPRLLTHALRTPEEKYYLVFGLLLLIGIGSYLLMNSRIGRAWAALSADEMAAVSCGINPIAAKCLAFGVGAGVAGIGGALFASIFSYVDPSQFEFRISAMVLAMVVIGGAGNVPGVILGALAVACYDQLFIPLVGDMMDRFGQAHGGWIALLTGIFNLRAFNFFAFGFALYLMVRLRAGRGTAMMQ